MMIGYLLLPVPIPAADPILAAVPSPAVVVAYHPAAVPNPAVAVAYRPAAGAYSHPAQHRNSGKIWFQG